MKDIVRLCVSLGVVCLLGAAALVYVNKVTEKPRQAAAQASLEEGLRLVLPPEMKSVATIEGSSHADVPEKHLVIVINDVKLYRAYDEKGDYIGIAAESEGKGFGGMIRTLTGIDKHGNILHVVVTAHSETPGLGTQATDRKLKKSLWGGASLAEGELPPNAYLDKKYTGKQADVFEQLDGVSGATYSSRGVHDAVNKACEAYQQYQLMANK